MISEIPAKLPTGDSGHRYPRHVSKHLQRTTTPAPANSGNIPNVRIYQISQSIAVAKSGWSTGESEALSHIDCRADSAISLRGSCRWQHSLRSVLRGGASGGGGGWSLAAAVWGRSLRLSLCLYASVLSWLLGGIGCSICGLETYVSKSSWISGKA